MITLLSYGLSKGPSPTATLLYSAAGLPNPHTRPELRPLTGQDTRVQEWLEAYPAFDKLVARVVAEAAKVPAGSTVAVGCWGGRHRSVAVVEEAAWRLGAAGVEVRVKHRELAK